MMFNSRKLRQSCNRISLFSCLLALAPFAHADDFASFESRLHRDNNVGNSRVKYAVGDTSYSNSFNFGRVLATGEDPYLWTFAGKLSKDSYQRLEGLDRLEIAGNIDLKKKWGLGPYAPVFGANLSYGLQQYAQNDKDRRVQGLELRASKRLIDALNVTARIAAEIHHGNHNESVEENHSGAVYEGRNRSWQVAFDYTILNDKLITLSYGIRRGDLVVTTISDSAAIYDVAKAIHPDPSFGLDRDAYRLDGEVKTLGLGFTVPISTQWTLQLDGQQHDSKVSNGVTYSRRTYSLSARYQF